MAQLVLGYKLYSVTLSVFSVSKNLSVLVLSSTGYDKDHWISGKAVLFGGESF